MLKSGDAFERHTIEALIGQGGMGRVYRAYDPRLSRRVALKVISEGSTHAAANARLVREARAAAAFDHPNAVAIFDVGELDGAPYIVMELVEGRTLRQVAGDTPLPVPTRLAQLSGVARALAAAHERGLVHRDIKPENCPPCCGAWASLSTGSSRSLPLSRTSTSTTKPCSGGSKTNRESTSARRPTTPRSPAHLASILDQPRAPRVRRAEPNDDRDRPS